MHHIDATLARHHELVRAASSPRRLMTHEVRRDRRRRPRRGTPVTGHADAAAGVRAMLPMVVAYAPFGLLVGAAVATSANPLAAWLSTWTIYGGAAHLAVLDVLQRDAGVLTAALVGLLINVRITAYAVSLAPQWRGTSRRARVVAALTLTDATWAMSHNRPGSVSARRRFYLGAALTLWVGWPSLVTLGVLVGEWMRAVPAATLLPTLTLGSLVIPHLRTAPGLAGAAGAAGIAFATTGLGSGPALCLAAVTGAGLATLVHRRQR